MKEKRTIVIEYGNVRVRLDHIGSYYPCTETSKVGNHHKYSIKYVLRSGEKLLAQGDDQALRNNVLDFLDDYFGTQSFDTNKCQVCTAQSADCERGCRAYDGFPNFNRKAA